jgi:hypothetical protein
VAGLPKGAKNSKETRVVVSVLTQFYYAAPNGRFLSEVAVHGDNQTVFTVGKCRDFRVRLRTEWTGMRVPTIHGCPFIMAGSIEIEGKSLATCSKSLDSSAGYPGLSPGSLQFSFTAG